MASPSSLCSSCLRRVRASQPRLLSNPSARLSSSAAVVSRYHGHHPQQQQQRQHTCSSSPRLSSPSSAASPLLDFLAPSLTRGAAATAATTRAAIQRRSSANPLLRSSRSISYSTRRPYEEKLAASSSSTASKPPPPPPSSQKQQQQQQHQPSIAIPPRHDANGNPMTVTITPRAAHRLAQLTEADKNPNLALRVSVESGGCHGFQYLLSLTTLDPSALDPSVNSPGDPTVTEGKATSSSSSSGVGVKDAEEDEEEDFEDDAAEDTVFIGPKNSKVVLDLPSLELLNGSSIDYTMELIGSEFKVVGIPGATSSCGCGTSFDVKL